MASSQRIDGRSRLVAAAVGSGFAVVLGAWLWGVASPERLLERSYARITPQGTLFLDDAGDGGASALAVTPARVTAAAAPAHLPVLVVDGEPVPSGILNEPLAAGDRVQFGGVGAGVRTIEVQDVADMAAPVVGLPGVRLQLVTARTVDQREPATLQLIFAVREASPAKVAPVARPAADKVL
ncbi:MAG: hypothetical protein ACK4TL_17190 [Hyphomicrobiaceae bacterium]